MKKTVFKMFFVMFLLLIGGIIIGNKEVYAEEDTKSIHIEDRILELNISKNNGVSLLPKENEIIYTNESINYAINTELDKSIFTYIPFTDEKSRYMDLYIDYKVTCQYAISTDKGLHYSDYINIEDGKFSLDPSGNKDGIYYVKFRKLEEFIKKDSIDDTVKLDTVENEPKSDTSVSDNVLYALNDAKTDDNLVKGLTKNEEKKLAKIILDEGIHAINSVEYAVCVDTVVPTVDFQSSSDILVWSNKNIKCNVVLNDTGSRLDKLIITNDDEVLAEETYSDDDSSTGKEKEFIISNESKTKAGNEIIITVFDKAGNKNTIEKRVYIDKTVPNIDFEKTDNNGIYDRQQNIKIKGDDIFPDTVSVAYTVKYIRDGEESIAEASCKTLLELNNSSLYNAYEDGDYIIECHATDLAGNASQIIRKNFRIDKTAPNINMFGITDNAILGYDAELIVNASDNFADTYKVALSGSLTTDKGTTNLKLADYKAEGKESNNTYYFNADGEYHISAVIEDEAGNENSCEISFCIDKVIPVISVSKGITAGITNVTNTPPVITYRINENNYSSAVVSCQLKRKSKKGNMELYLEPEWTLQSAQDDFSLEITEEGYYEAYVLVSDAAGNNASKTVSFTLDMTSPEIDYVGDLNQKYVKSFKLPENFSEYITDATGVSYETYLNSKNYDETQEIASDGKYILKVSAVDDAGNQAEKTIEFIVDSTNPRVVIEGMDDEGNVSMDEPLILSLYEEDDYFKSVKINGVEQITEEHQHEVCVNVPEYGDYTIEVEACDMAENVLTQSIMAKCANASPVEIGTTTVKTLKQAEQKGSNKGLRVFLIIMTVVILAGSITGISIYFIKQNEQS